MKEKLLVTLEDCKDREIIGNKSYNLYLLKQKIGINKIPECLILGNNSVQDAKIDFVQLLQELKSTLHYPIIARSSTSVEDGTVSFAGQFISDVCYNDDDLINVTNQIISSVDTEQIKIYCKLKNINFEDIKVAVLYQPYLKCEMSGVMFTKNPVTNNTNEIVIEYKELTSDAVTSGTSIPKNIILNKYTKEKYNFPFCNLFDIGLKTEDFFNQSVDIEWIVSDGELWIVQCRQITT
jgi:phosphoenolpyruvate synthase/pyruvate phosphate dikinase